MLSPRHPNLRLIIVGPGSDDEDLRMQAAALRVLHLVSFLGERDDQVNLMRDADLGWVVADGDTGVYGILDLMALGIPTVASEGGVAQRYIAHGISGALYPPDDSASTAATVAGMLMSEEARETMGKAARVRVARENSARSRPSKASIAPPTSRAREPAARGESLRPRLLFPTLRRSSRRTTNPRTSKPASPLWIGPKK